MSKWVRSVERRHNSVRGISKWHILEFEQEQLDNLRSDTRMVGVSADGFILAPYEVAENLPPRGAVCGYCINRWTREQRKRSSE